jgi:hypothetical protein
MRRARLAVVTAAVALAGCGGGVWFGIEGGFDDTPPSISMAAGAASVGAGQPLRVVAAVADESGVERVEFFRIDGNATVRLATLGGPPWEITTLVPADGRTQLQLFARATDVEGNAADSAVLTVAVTP